MWLGGHHNYLAAPLLTQGVAYLEHLLLGIDDRFVQHPVCIGGNAQLNQDPLVVELLPHEASAPQRELFFRTSRARDPYLRGEPPPASLVAVLSGDQQTT